MSWGVGVVACMAITRVVWFLIDGTGIEMTTTKLYWNLNYNSLHAVFDGMRDARRHPNRHGARSREAVIDAVQNVLGGDERA